MTSDFFLEEADEWRESMGLYKQRPDVTFSLLTKYLNGNKDYLFQTPRC